MNDFHKMKCYNFLLPSLQLNHGVVVTYLDIMMSLSIIDVSNGHKNKNKNK